MASYLEVKKQAEDLMLQAEQMRLEELSSAIADIKAKMAQYGITLEDLGGRSAGNGPVRRTKKAAAPAGEIKFRGPNGEGWGGGRGRKPQWVQNILASGQNIEDYRV
jgi:DNA-binding protein H-NS